MFYNKKIENDAISSALYNEGCVNQLLELDKDDFYLADNRHIYTAIDKLYNDNSSVGMSGVHDELLKIDETVADRFLTAQLGSNDCHPSHMEYYVKTIRKYSNRRKIYTDLDDAVKELKNDTELETVIDGIEKSTQDIDNLDAKYGTFADDDIDDNNLDMTGEYFPTGLGAIDDSCRGFFRGNTIVLAAMPKQGKSTLAFNIAQHISQTKEVLFFSLEMTRNELYYRLLAKESNVSMNEILRNEKIDIVKKAIPGIKEKYKRILVYDTISKLHLIKAESRKQVRRFDVGLIVVDYIQLVDVKGETGLREKTVEITRQLKQLAMELNVPILELSQFSRHDENEWPKLNWLKESGSIEEDANLVLFLHTEKMKDEADKQYLIVEAGRNVAKDSYRVEHSKGFFKFKDYVERFKT